MRPASGHPNKLAALGTWPMKLSSVHGATYFTGCWVRGHHVVAIQDWHYLHLQQRVHCIEEDALGGMVLQVVPC